MSSDTEEVLSKTQSMEHKKFVMETIKLGYINMTYPEDVCRSINGIVIAHVVQEAKPEVPETENEPEEQLDQSGTDSSRSTDSKNQLGFDVASYYLDPNAPEVKPVTSKGVFCTQELVEQKYAELAKQHVELMEANKNHLSARDILDVLRIRTIAAIKKELTFIIKTLRVDIGYRRIKFTIETPDSRKRVRYICNPSGCFIRYGNNEPIFRRDAFQSAAASDFIYLLSNNIIKLDRLEVDVMDTQEEEPRVFPFQAFFNNVGQLMERLEVHIQARHFSMKTFKPHGSVLCANSLILQILPRLVSWELESLEFRLWNDKQVPKDQRVQIALQEEEPSDLLRSIFDTPQWKQAKSVDINGKGISVEEQFYHHFHHFEKVHAPFPEGDHKKFVEEMQKIIRSFQNIIKYEEKHTCTIVIPPEFNPTIVSAHADFMKFGVWEQEEEKLSATLPNGVQMELRKGALVFTIDPEEVAQRKQTTQKLLQEFYPKLSS